MASPFTADVGRIARTLPFTLPRGFNRRRILFGLLLAAALAAGYLFWFKDSSLVAVNDVDIKGLTYAEEEIGAALTAEAEEMSTLDADVAALEDAVEKFPTVASVAIDPRFPHGLAITVTERPPVGLAGGEEGVAIAGDGTVLGAIDADAEKLPAIQIDDPPASGSVDGAALIQAEVLGAAPEPLRPAIQGTEVSKEVGVVVNLVEGIEIRFGDSSDATAKWAAAAAILSDPKLDELDYADVRLPGRPAVGGTALPSSAAEPDPEAPAPIAPEAPAPAPAATTPAPAAPTTPDPAVAPTVDPAAATPPAPAPATGVAGTAAAP